MVVFRRHCKRNVVPNSNPLRIKGFVLSISVSFEYECYIIMQMNTPRILIPLRIMCREHDGLCDVFVAFSVWFFNGV